MLQSQAKGPGCYDRLVYPVKVADCAISDLVLSRGGWWSQVLPVSRDVRVRHAGLGSRLLVCLGSLWFAQF